MKKEFLYLNLSVLENSFRTSPFSVQGANSIIYQNKLIGVHTSKLSIDNNLSVIDSRMKSNRWSI